MQFVSMRDPATIYTKKGTPIILVASRIIFISYFIFFFIATHQNWFPDGAFNLYWWVYLVVLYGIAEIIYNMLRKKGIDLTFAFPLLFLLYLINFFSLLVRAQETFPLINRAEHFTSFVLLAYIVWIFFIKYLPQEVWKRHPYYTALLVLSVTSLAGVANEIIELFLDSMFGTETIGPGNDTSLDLLMNTLGAGLFLSVQLIMMSAEKPPDKQ